MSRLPAFGEHGQGWVTGQFFLIAAVGVAGVIDRPDWDGTALLVSQVVGASLTVLGVVIGILGVRDLGDALTPLPYPKDGAPLVQTGMYSRVRHPLYVGSSILALGVVIAAWSVPLAFGAMVGVSLLTRASVPGHARRFMVRLHTPEVVPLDRG